MTTVSYGLCLPLFLAVTGERRVKLGALMAAGYGAVMTVVAVISLVACFTGKPIYLPYAADMIGVKLNRLFVLGRHPNEVGSCMNLALLCWLLLCLCTKRWLLKAVCMAMAVPVYLAIGATTSRTAVVIASLVLAIFVVAIALDRLKAQKRGRQWLIGAAALTLAAAVSLVVLIYGVPSLLRGQTDAMTAKTTEVAASADAAAEPEDKLVSRGLTDDVDTVTSRFKIWKSGFDYIKDHPKTLLIGSTDGIVARIQTYYLRWPANHMQNALLEVLLQGGILGLALYLAFLLQFLRSAFVLFVKPDAVCWQRFIAAASVATLLSVAMETYPSLSGQTMDLVFMVIAGAVIGLARGGTAAVVKDQRSIADE